MIAALALALAAAAAPALPLPDPAGEALRAGVTACASRENWMDNARLAELGWQQGAHYSLQARGQRAQAYSNPALNGRLTFHSSFILYVACSTSADLASPADYAASQAAVIAQTGAQPAKLADVSLSENAKAFMQEYQLDTGQDIYTTPDNLFIFRQNQVDDRTIFAVYVVVREKGKP